MGLNASSPFCERGGFFAVYGLFANSGMGQLWERFSFKRLVSPRCHKALWHSRQSQEGCVTPPLPSTHPHHTLSLCLSSPALKISGISKAISKMGVHFQNYERAHPSLQFGIKPLSCSLGLFVQMRNECVEAEAVTEAAVDDHRQSQWT